MSGHRPESDVCVIVEGAYPFVVGGVSSWLQDLIASMPDIRFSVVAIKAHDVPEPWLVKPPPNVVEVVEVPLSSEPAPPRRYPAARVEQVGRLLISFLKAGDRVVLGDLIAALRTLDPPPRPRDIISSQALFGLLQEHYSQNYPTASFRQYFWAMRVLLGGLLAVLLAPLPRARTYHTLSTGFAGLVAARAAIETGRPTMITEHGIYLIERRIEVMMASWIGDQVDTGLLMNRGCGDLRDLWLAAFESYARSCYDACDPIIALYRANNATQEQQGAVRERLRAIPNGIDPDRFAGLEDRRDPHAPLIALVGRVVPIKDIKTFIRAAALVAAEVPGARFAVLGPEDEDSHYAEDCHALVAELAIGDRFEFAGRVNVADWMPRIDILVLTSLSEAQPLVILEAGACGIPVVAPDVGSCRELIEGSDEDRRPGGIVTALINPPATAKAIATLLHDPTLRVAMGDALRERVIGKYDYAKIVNEYRSLYGLPLKALAA